MLLISLIALLILSVLSGLGVNTIRVSSVEFPAIYIDPSETWDENLDPGDNYTISIKTDYNGSDIWSYEFTLYYNPNVLHGGINYTDTWIATGFPFFLTAKQDIVPDSEKVYVNDTLQTRDVDYLITYLAPKDSYIYFLPSHVPDSGANVKAIYLYNGLVNGNLITTNVDPNATFMPGMFNNTLGELEYTIAYFYYEAPETPPTASGPGILANITFTVVGRGFSDITLGDNTKLRGYNGVFYDIIDASTTEGKEHIQHGFFSNIPPRHDVAVASLVAPSSAAIEQPVPIDVNVTNEGTYDESVTLTVYYDTTVINSTTFPLEKGLSDIKSFSWDTSGAAEGTYEINATATIAQDDDLSDNNRTKTITLSLVYDVAVVSLVAPSLAAIEFPVPIDVTVVNEGSYDENVTLTVYYDTTVIDSANFLLAKGPTSNMFSFSWDTSGAAEGTYEINATATVLVSAENPTGIDEDLSDNNKTQTIQLQMLHDVAVVSLVAKPESYQIIEYPVSINVTVANEGSYNENVSLTVYYKNIDPPYNTGDIGATTFTLAKGPTSNMFSFSWDTSGAAEGTYEINATATITQDDDLSNNNKTRDITLDLVHDVAVVSVTAPLRGNVNNTVLINVTVENTGSFPETFNVTTYYDDTAIVLPNGKNYTTVTLASAESTTILFTWNTTGVAPDFYTIKAKASNVTGETNTADNTKTWPWDVLVTILGDVNGDGAVGTSDLIAFSEAYGSEPGDPNWNPYCDFNGDDKVDILDMSNLGKNYGKTV